MQSENPEAKKKWYSRGRWAIVFSLIGVLIIVFVAATGGEYGAWTMWIAVPLLMLGLGYLFVINAIPVFLSYDAAVQTESEEQEKPRGDT